MLFLPFYLDLCMLGNFSCFCCCVKIFFKINFFKKFFQEHYQSVKWFGFKSDRTNILSALIWVRSVCKGYQPMTKVAASKERVTVKPVLSDQSKRRPKFVFKTDIRLMPVFNLRNFKGAGEKYVNVALVLQDKRLTFFTPPANSHALVL